MNAVQAQPATGRSTTPPASRAVRRTDVHIPVQIEVAGEQMRGWASHVSEHGIRLTCCGPLHNDESVALTLTLPIVKRTLTVRAVVSRSHAFTHVCVLLGTTADQRHALRDEAFAATSAAS